MNDVAIFWPLTVGTSTIVATVLIHTLAVAATVRFLRRAKRMRREDAGFWNDVGVVMVAVFLALVAHLLEIGVWGVVFIACGEFPAFAIALDHSAVNYTTLGYGNVIMTPSWRFLGPLEAVNGMLLFGVSTALIFAVIQGLIQSRFADLRHE
jgi:Ion channel